MGEKKIKKEKEKKRKRKIKRKKGTKKYLKLTGNWEE
jgi:hypothetical protein